METVSGIMLRVRNMATMKNRKHVLRILTVALVIMVLVGYFCWGKGGSLATPTPAQTIAQEGTIVVTSTSDSGLGTLRWALLEAQSGDIITFDPAVFPPDAPVTIYVTSSLPAITQGNLTVDASNVGVVLDGSAITDWQVNGLEITSDGNIISGLQIINFPNAAVGLLGGAQNNIVGGDRSVGTGPLGQGNLLSGNGSFGVGIWDADTSFNTIIGNYIGTALNGTAAWGIHRDGVHMNGASHNQVINNLISGNGGSGVYICCARAGARDNVIGPDNIIAYNNEDGIAIDGSNSFGNTITQNSIRDNGRQGISLREGGNAGLPAPSIFDFDLAAGTVTGAAYANCTVEIFSDKTYQGEIFEGRMMADSLGVFTFNKGLSFTGPHLTATITDADGDTSPFSAPTWGTNRSTVLQEGNNLPKTQLQTKQSRELDDNRMAAGFSCLWPPQDYEHVLNMIVALGLKRVDLTIQENEAPIDWSKPELDIPPEFDNFITALAQNGITITYLLSFWDKANHPQGWEGISSRFKTEEEIQRYLDFVRFIVRHFKDRVQYFKIWSEPDNCGDPAQCVEVSDMINLIWRVVPVIRQEYPEAKVVIPSNVIFFAQDYLFSVLNSDVMPTVDVVVWQTMPDYGPSDESWRAFYSTYPSLVQQIKDTASAHGFMGEYWASVLTWWFPAHPSPPLPYPDSAIVDAKDNIRGIAMHLGMGVTIVGLGTNYESLIAWPTIRNLCTVMAGAAVVSLPVTIEGAAADIKKCGFTVPNGSHMVILWRNVEPVADDSGVKVNLTLQDFAAQDVMGIDVLEGFQQRMMISNENGNLTIRNLMVRDYPLILRVEHAEATIETCDSTGLNRNVFNLTETVYVNGTGYSPSATYEICVVNDVASWSDGMEIPARIPGTATTISTDSSGNIHPTTIWSAGLNLGKYDIVVDVDGNGVYDEEIDALDNDDIEVTAGFLAIPEFPSFLVLPLFTITLLLAVIIYRRNHSM